MSVRTVRRWIRAGHAPRSVLMALHRVSRAGQYELHAAILRDLRAVDDWGLSMQRDNEALRRELARVLAAGDFGSANAPSLRETAADLLASRPRAVRR